MNIGYEDLTDVQKEAVNHYMKMKGYTEDEIPDVFSEIASDSDNALEFLDERFLCFFADPFDVQFGPDHVLASLLSVEFDGETVHLILDGCEETEGFIRWVEVNNPRWKAENQLFRAVFFVLG